MSTAQAYCGDADNVAYTGSLDTWGGVADVPGAPNDAFADVFYQEDGTSDILYVHDFGFTLPTGATVTGIAVKVWYRITLTAGYGTNGADIDLYVSATKDGTTFTGETSILTLNPTSTPYETAPVGDFLTVESSSGTWGTSFTEAEVEAAAFGFGIRMVVNLDDTFNNFTSTIDAVQVTITYTDARRYADTDEVIYG